MISRPALGRLLNLSLAFIGEDRPNRPGTPIRPRFITIHNTANPHPGADAEAHARFVRERGFYRLASGRKRHVSWHFTVDDRRVIKHLPISERAIHAGPGNATSIGIEICMHEGIDQPAADLRAERLAAVLMHDLGLGPEAVVPHAHWTGKRCPLLLLDRFHAFREAAAEVAAAIGPDPRDPADERHAGPEPVSAAEIAALTVLDACHVPPGEETAPEPDPADAHDRVADALSEMLAAR